MPSHGGHKLRQLVLPRLVSSFLQTGPRVPAGDRTSNHCPSAAAGLDFCSNKLPIFNMSQFIFEQYKRKTSETKILLGKAACGVGRGKPAWQGALEAPLMSPEEETPAQLCWDTGSGLPGFQRGLLNFALPCLNPTGQKL